MTTVQDLGRTGYQSQGFSVAGVMDVRSFKIANLLLDNPENEAVLEITLIGPTLEFTSATIIAITGGDFQPTINGEPAPMYTALYMNKGDVLKFGSARTGSRAYIAFSSYLDIPVVMGSRCTNLKSKLGGFKGRKLQAGDYIGFRIKRRYLPFFLSRKLDIDEYDQTEATLRVVMGPQNSMFSKQGIDTFLHKSRYLSRYLPIIYYIMSNGYSQCIAYQVVPRSTSVTGNTVLVGTTLPASICTIAEIACSAICSTG